MKIIIALLIILVATTGCATKYHAERTSPFDGATVVLDVKSYREFKGGVQIKYNRELGVFELQAGEVTNDGAEAMRDVILGVLPLINSVDGG